MAAIPQIEIDPTLQAIDAAIEEKENRQKPRHYVGMSAIGNECERALWYGYRWASKVRHNAETIKRFIDGHLGEDMQAARLRMVDGVTLLTIDPETGKQIGFVDLDGHFKGHADGAILGILQAEKTWHIWEHKQTSEKKLDELQKLITLHGQKGALAVWNPVYYAQAVLYMHYSGFTRHYMTVSTPGGRHTISLRTEADPDAAMRQIAKAERIIKASTAPDRAFANADFFMCKWCDHRAVCWEGAKPDRHCRSCLRSTPAKDGAWGCEKFGAIPADCESMGCEEHLFLPCFIDGEAVDANESVGWVNYKMRDGTEWCDGILF